MTLPPIANLEQYATHVGAPPAGTDVIRVMSLLAEASAMVRARSGQQFTRSVSTRVPIRITQGRLRLPQRPVVAVTEVFGPSATTGLVNPSLALSARFDGLETITVNAGVPNDFAFEPFRTAPTVAYVTYTHGYLPEEMPADILAVVCGMAARASGVPADRGGYQQEQTGPYMVSLSAAAGQGALGMTEGEREVVDRYGFRPNAAIRMAPPIGLGW